MRRPASSAHYGVMFSYSPDSRSALLVAHQHAHELQTAARWHRLVRGLPDSPASRRLPLPGAAGLVGFDTAPFTPVLRDCAA
jgi:predicted deacylase